MSQKPFRRVRWRANASTLSVLLAHWNHKPFFEILCFPLAYSSLTGKPFFPSQTQFDNENEFRKDKTFTLNRLGQSVGIWQLDLSLAILPKLLGFELWKCNETLIRNCSFSFGCRRILPSVILNRACGSFRGLRLFTISDSLLQLVAEILRQIFTGFASFLFFNLLERDLNAWMRLQTVFNLNAQLGIQVILLR